MSKLMLGDVALHYQILGEGEDVVLIHGLGANLAFWYMGIARLLARRYRVIAYDLRGHGRSSMPPSGYTLPDMGRDLLTLLDHLQIDRAHLVGHSFGARVALYFSIASGERVASLTVADTQVQSLQPAVPLCDWPYWQIWKAQLQAQGFNALPADSELINFRMLAYFNQINADFTQGALSAQGMVASPRPRLAPSLRRRDMGQKGGAQWERLLTLTGAGPELEDERSLTVEALQRISAPTLAAYGEYSHCLPSARRLQELLPNCRVVIVPGAGHFHPAVKPRLFTRLLFRWLMRETGAVWQEPGQPADWTVEPD